MNGCALPMRSTLLMTLTCGSSRFIIAAQCQGPATVPSWLNLSVIEVLSGLAPVPSKLNLSVSKVHGKGTSSHAREDNAASVYGCYAVLRTVIHVDWNVIKIHTFAGFYFFLIEV